MRLSSSGMRTWILEWSRKSGEIQQLRNCGPGTHGWPTLAVRDSHPQGPTGKFQRFRYLLWIHVISSPFPRLTLAHTWHPCQAFSDQAVKSPDSKPSAKINESATGAATTFVLLAPAGKETGDKRVSVAMSMT